MVDCFILQSSIVLKDTAVYWTVTVIFGVVIGLVYLLTPIFYNVSSDFSSLANFNRDFSSLCTGALQSSVVDTILVRIEALCDC